MVRRWGTDFLEGRAEVQDQQRAGRPKTVIIDDAVEAVDKNQSRRKAIGYW